MRDRLLKKSLRDRFVITLKSGQSFDGLLEELDHSHYRFVDAHLLDENQDGRMDRPRLNGDLWVDRVNVAYMQRLPRASG